MTPSQEGHAAAAIRSATSADISTIVQFNTALAWETEHRRLPPDVIHRGVERALADRHLCRYYVAEMAGQVVGQTMLTYELTDWEDGLVWWIQSVYVRPEFRGRGVFKALHGFVMGEAARDGNVRRVRLYVEKDNVEAIKTYAKLGMTEAHFYIYETRLSELS